MDSYRPSLGELHKVLGVVRSVYAASCKVCPGPVGKLARNTHFENVKSFNQLPVEPLMIGNHELEVEILPPEQRNRLDGINDA